MPGKKTNLTYPCYNVVENAQKQGGLTCTHVTPSLNEQQQQPPFSISAHSIKWKYKLEGTPRRNPTWVAQLRGWRRYGWRFMGVELIANKQTLEIWVERPKTSNMKRLLSAAWAKADRARREFSKWQQVGLQELPGKHLLGADKAHICIEENKINNELVPITKAGLIPYKPEGVGAEVSQSHAGKFQMSGKQSIEGAQGFEWLVLNYQQEFNLLHAKTNLCADSLAGFAEYNRNIQLHLKVLNEMSETMKAIRESLIKK